MGAERPTTTKSGAYRYGGTEPARSELQASGAQAGDLLGGRATQPEERAISSGFSCLILPLCACGAAEIAARFAVEWPALVVRGTGSPVFFGNIEVSRILVGRGRPKRAVRTSAPNSSGAGSDPTHRRQPT